VNIRNSKAFSEIALIGFLRAARHIIINWSEINKTATAERAHSHSSRPAASNKLSEKECERYQFISTPQQPHRNHAKRERIREQVTLPAYVKRAVQMRCGKDPKKAKRVRFIHLSTNRDRCRHIATVLLWRIKANTAGRQITPLFICSKPRAATTQTQIYPQAKSK